MADIDRREFASILTAIGLAPGVVGTAPAQSAPASEVPDAPPDVTRALARYVVRTRPEDIPPPSSPRLAGRW